MVVGACRLTLVIPEASSLKAKRSVVKKVIARVKAKFDLSIAEVEAQDNHRMAVLGFAIVGNDHRFVNAMIDHVLNHIRQLFLADLVDHSYEILNVL